MFVPNEQESNGVGDDDHSWSYGICFCEMMNRRWNSTTEVVQRREHSLWRAMEGRRCDRLHD